jgi:hypothetical protein
VVGAEIVVGYVFAWAVRKARRVGTRADEQVDAALEAGVDRAGGKLHELVVGRLKHDPALARLVGEAEQGAEVPTPRTVQRVALALEDAADQDPQFAAAVDALTKQLQVALASPSAAWALGGVLAGAQQISAESGGIAAGVINGGVRIENPSGPGLPKG